MRKVITLALIVSAFTFSGCKKCWKCSPIAGSGSGADDAESFEVCDKATKDVAERSTWTAANGQDSYRVDCKVHYESK